MANAKRLPLIEELPTHLSSIELFEVIHYDANSFFLDSAMTTQRQGRYSMIGTDPFLIFSSRGEKITVGQNGGATHLQGNPLDILGRYLETYHLDKPDSQLPCSSGAVGYFSYDLGRFMEVLPAKAVDDLQIPECRFGFYDLMLVLDHLANRILIVSTGFPEQDETRRAARARERIEWLKNRISAYPGLKAGAIPEAGNKTGEINLKSNFTHEAYIRAVEKARQYIIDGDIFEVNLSQRYEADISIAPFELYRRLRKINPAPFATYLNFDEVKVVGSSPERFLRLEGDRVETRPIKGTIRRGKNSVEDESNARRLLNSAKDRAENMMIVDLERNDLGRVCRYGTVKVTELAILEKFPTVYHLTSTITGQLGENVSRIELLKATFPGGSITGAPKIRSMEIIDELEPTRRSIYTGSIGYFSFDGDIDLNIVIRTFLIKGNRAYFQLGGAVVFDSDPEAEFQETLDKGRALFGALER